MPPDTHAPNPKLVAVSNEESQYAEVAPVHPVATESPVVLLGIVDAEPSPLVANGL